MQVGEAFPQALAFVRPHLTVSATILHLIGRSTVPEDWPRDALDLLWITREEAPGAGYYELAGLLDRIQIADPTLEADRRLQWLELRAPRFR